MNKQIAKIVLVAGVIAAAGIIIYTKENPSKAASALPAAEAKDASPIADNAVAAAGVPKLVDLGADKCIPCKMMAPILDQLKKDYAGRMEIEFIDVWKNPAAGAQYGIQSIPTQIFYDASGNELRRHIGFMSREDILRTWDELAIVFPAAVPGGS
jgi:thioredoxin 1